MRLIDADKLLIDLKAAEVVLALTVGEKCADMSAMIQTIVNKYAEELPVEAEPVRHGQNVSPTHYSDEFTCSACGFSCEITELRYDDEDGFGMGAATEYEYDCKFCPDCGAKMDKED